MQLNTTMNRLRRGLWVSGAFVVLALTTTLALLFVGGGGSAAVTSASTADASLLSSVLDGLSTDPASVSLTAPPAVAADAGSSKWLTVTHPAGQTTPEHVEGLWYASLIAGGYGAQCDARGADCAAGLTFVGVNGPHEDDFTAAIVMQPLTMTSASPSELSATITKRLAAEGITASSITFEHPYGPAAIVEIQSSDPQTIVTNLNDGSVLGDLGLDGYLVRIDDAKGNVVYLDAVSDRAGVGTAWFAPYLKVPNLP